MPNLPVKRMVLYKHGVGFFERLGALGPESSVTLTFKKEEMNDILKSLAAFPQGDGQVVNVSYETPEEKQDALSKAPLVLSDRQAWLDLVRSLRGCQVRLHIAGSETDGAQERIISASGSEFVVSGCMVGLNQIAKKPEQTLVAIMTTGSEADSTPSLRTFLLSQVRGLDILDARSGDDLRYVLDLSQSREEQRSVTIFLDRPNQDLLVSYVAPSPTWRVSYRLVYTPNAPAEGSDVADNSDSGQLFIQGWGIVDNQLDEDLEDVSLTLIAGQPISFIYDLYTPRLVDRPTVEDEARTVAGPVSFEEGRRYENLKLESRELLSDVANRYYESALDEELAAPGMGSSRFKSARRDLAQATQVQATGVARGELFQYDVGIPVTIKRGQSAMVPILGATLASRKQHWFNAEKLPDHPVVTIVATNTTGLTLERGPATVLEAENYVGEAVLNFTPAEGEFFVPYAVDLGVQISREDESRLETAAIALGKGDYLVHDQWETRQTVYCIDNRNTYPVVLVIEQRILSGYELFDTAEPMEQTAEFQRWKLAIAPRQQSEFCVQQRQKISRHEQILNLDYQTLQAYLHNKFINASLFQELRGILDLHQQIAQMQQEIQKLAKKRDRLSEEQESIAKKLQPLKNSGSENDLREKLAAKMSHLEDERDRLQDTITAQEQTQDSLKQRLRQLLQELH
ncbi:hypothetical protein [Thermoleptolyngbya sp. C42_A2020_037]|uniref:hypothetical protein n=1 Tax=Thermoleptolyngbya sp. C42_A2020_037 TaxID=2747799 RepID=UPI0019F90410|nr:hypothetical protein [Thermoleptolyngbya sp. C42_A2020_037]MBF2087129.1 hypothetical protein [Thermoleptolyngbya sp. C42_A2020_037]